MVEEKVCPRRSKFLIMNRPEFLVIFTNKKK